jgi:hypothetical protein
MAEGDDAQLVSGVVQDICDAIEKIDTAPARAVNGG